MSIKTTWRQVQLLVIFFGFLAFCWIAHKTVEKSRVSDLKKKVSELKNVQRVFDHTVSILTIEQKKTLANAAMKYFDSQKNSIETRKVYNLFKIPKPDEKTVDEEKTEDEETAENEVTEKKGG